MPLDFINTRKLLQSFDFKTLFIEELGWDRYTSQPIEISVDAQAYSLAAIAEKRGLVAFICGPGQSGRIPDYSIRRKIEKQVSKTVHEHLIIYTDVNKTTQTWQWVKREAGKPTACREHTYHKSQSGEALIQKLQNIVFNLDEEEKLTIVEAAGRARAAFDVDKVTKRFYDRFKTEHTAILKFIKGIGQQDDLDWYASVMLNRLMFVYFIQKKGFLGNDVNYLSNKLKDSNGKDRFYRDFLLRLFFEGFAKEEKTRPREVNNLLGKVPYLNGGIFLPHPLEQAYNDKIQIPDTAFERLFAFFDQYHWHLDERPLRADNEINPDVLGYIFEKYINQKQMGAYYTKEDITEYISKNTVIPFLFDEAKKKCKIAFEGERSVWSLLKEDPDRYIYPAIQKGAELPLPEDIAAGIPDVSRRTQWNRPAPQECALPTESWREVVARRKRYEELRAKLAAGDVHSIDELITQNLDIRQFAQDVIENSEGPELLRAFWHAIYNVTVLDPTCGSGAFLFAALNILEPLYEACLNRMQAFIEDLDGSGKKHHPEKFSDFRKVLEGVAKHPNHKYFVFKSIIINNLYGVDIMEEATEICKLRLFLKLVAQVGRVDEIEPLPDIDFNIRAGNTLVGYASYDEVKKAVTSKLDFDDSMERIEEKAQDLDRLFSLFREMQTEHGMTAKSFTDAKQKLRGKLKELEDELNRYLAGEYKINPNKKAEYDKWLRTHHPFHWFVEFYGIVKSGGFDVIIGNPPYVEYKNIRQIYQVRGFITEDCGDLYAFVMERSDRLLATDGYMGMIVPVSITSTDGFSSLRKFLCKTGRTSWSLGFAERPSKLFTGVEKRLTIWLMSHKPSNEPLFLSNYRRWLSEERDTLFSTVRLVGKNDLPTLVGSSIPKIALPCETQILRRLSKQTPLDSFYLKHSLNIIYYTRKVRYFVQFFDFIPNITDAKGTHVEPSELKMLYLSTPQQRDVALAILNSGLFFWFFCTYSDVRNVNRREIEAFPCSIDKMNGYVNKELQRLSKDLMADFKKHAKVLTNDYGQHGKLTIQTFQPRVSKHILDEIDRVLAKHYGFTEEELDFIINYDIKYRMGMNSEEDD
jgi:type I restriction-modification system DNA methylase subunit